VALPAWFRLDFEHLQRISAEHYRQVKSVLFSGMNDAAYVVAEDFEENLVDASDGPVVWRQPRQRPFLCVNSIGSTAKPIEQALAKKLSSM